MGEKRKLELKIGDNNGRQTLVVNVAYAHCEGQEPSILNDQFRFNEEIDFLEKPNQALNVFNFTDTAFRTEVLANGDTQKQTIHLTMSDTGRLDIFIDDDPLD